jgi:hypothetical protein
MSTYPAPLVTLRRHAHMGKQNLRGQAWWCITVIPTMWEAEVRGSVPDKSSRHCLKDKLKHKGLRVRLRGRALRHKAPGSNPSTTEKTLKN